MARLSLSGIKTRILAVVAFGVVSSVAGACSQSDGTSGGRSLDGPDASSPTSGSLSLRDERLPTDGVSDTSRASIQRGPTVQVSHAESSPPFATAPERPRDEDEAEIEHRPLRVPRTFLPMQATVADPVAQTRGPVATMPATLLNFSGQGGGAFSSYPPDTNGAVGSSHFVQAVNTNLEIWHKTGTVAQASKAFNALWAGYTGTNPGNGCATQDDGDPVVVYDQLADRWFITQFSLPNTSTVGGPAFQCIAVSKTADPTGAYWLYDFKYDYSINDYGKFGIWPDGYYATFNLFDYNADPNIQFDFKGADLCAYDRVSMLAGQPAAQQCFLQAFPAVATCPTDGGSPPVEPFQVSGALPISLDGRIPPPAGAPGYFMQFDYSQCGPTYNQVDLWSLHLDWKTPANSKLNGPNVVQVASYTPTCYSAQGADCIPEKGGTKVAALDDRLMFRFTYRNFGTHESLLVNHSVVAGNTGGVRWYELRLPGGTPTLFQQGTYAPSDANWRWMASLAQDMAQDMALGYSISSATTNPSIAWTGRTVADPAGTMGQSEAVIDVGAGNQTQGRWGDYSNMTVDPTDDCTFWYTQELYSANGSSTWKTFIATTSFPACGTNDFSISLSPASRSVAAGSTTTYTVTTASIRGTAESLVLNVQDLPAGVTGAFVPATVVAGTPSTLTLTAASSAPATASPVTFTVIGKAPSAVHAASAAVSVTGGCVPQTSCPAGDDCGTVGDGCGGLLTCHPGCTAQQTCVANHCVAIGVDAGTDSGIDSGVDAGVDSGVDAGIDSGIDSGIDAGVDSGTDAGTTDAGCTPTSCGAQSAACGTIDDGCNGTLSCGTCPANETCSATNQCVASGVDAGAVDAGARDAGGKKDSGAPAADAATSDGGDTGTPGDNGGCGCRVARSADATPSNAWLGFGALGLVGALRLRRRRRA